MSISSGTGLEWRGSGVGEAVVFIHGFPLNSAMWGPQLAGLPSGWRGIAPDLRGFGASPLGDPVLSTMEQYARDVANLLDQLHIERAVICGLSMGGYVAFELWRLFRERVRGLVLCDTRADADSPKARIARNRTAERVLVDGTQVVEDGLLPKLVSPLTTRRQPGTVSLVRAMIQETAPETIAAALRAMAARPDSDALLRTIDAPALVIWGADDAITGRGQVEMLARGIRGARLESIEGAGPLPNLEQPASFNQMLAHFLPGLPQPRVPARSPSA
jgi:pimeloyl-ACP methyl ester carboxylesterase